MRFLGNFNSRDGYWLATICVAAASYLYIAWEVHRLEPGSERLEREQKESLEYIKRRFDREIPSAERHRDEAAERKEAAELELVETTKLLEEARLRKQEAIEKGKSK